MLVARRSNRGVLETERRGDSALSSAKNNMRRVAKLIRASPVNPTTVACRCRTEVNHFGANPKSANGQKVRRLSPCSSPPFHMFGSDSWPSLSRFATERRGFENLNGLGRNNELGRQTPNLLPFDPRSPQQISPQWLRQITIGPQCPPVSVIVKQNGSIANV